MKSDLKVLFEILILSWLLIVLVFINPDLIWHVILSHISLSIGYIAAKIDNAITNFNNSKL